MKRWEAVWGSGNVVSCILGDILAISKFSAGLRANRSWHAPLWRRKIVNFLNSGVHLFLFELRGTHGRVSRTVSELFF